MFLTENLFSGVYPWYFFHLDINDILRFFFFTSQHRCPRKKKLPPWAWFSIGTLKKCPKEIKRYRWVLKYIYYQQSFSPIKRGLRQIFMHIGRVQDRRVLMIWKLYLGNKLVLSLHFDWVSGENAVRAGCPPTINITSVKWTYHALQRAPDSHYFLHPFMKKKCVFFYCFHTVMMVRNETYVKWRRLFGNQTIST